MSRYINWEEWKIINLEETMKMFRTMNKRNLIPGIEEVVGKDPTSKLDPEDTLPVHVIPDEG